MKNLRLLFLALYTAGLLLALGLFLALVPRWARSNVAWLDFAMAAILYTGFWGRYAMLYRKAYRFATNVPALALFWSALSKCTFLSVLVMVLGHYMHLRFEVQLMLQAIVLFLLLLVSTVGMAASRKVQEDDDEIREQTETIKSIRSQAEAAGVAVDGLPPSHTAVRNAFRAIREELQYLSGCSRPEAQAAEADILESLRGFTAICDAGVSPEECLSTLRRLSTDIAVRRKMTNG